MTRRASTARCRSWGRSGPSLISGRVGVTGRVRFASGCGASETASSVHPARSTTEKRSTFEVSTKALTPDHSCKARIHDHKQATKQIHTQLVCTSFAPLIRIQPSRPVCTVNGNGSPSLAPAHTSATNQASRRRQQLLLHISHRFGARWSSGFSRPFRP